MKRLFLIRHAKSSWDDPTQSDFNRPLNERGKRDAPFMSKFLANSHPDIELIITSPAKRTFDTAVYFATALKKDEKDILRVPEIYEASLNQLRRIVSELTDECESAILVGHNPGLSMLLYHYTEETFDMPTCAIAEIMFDHNNWSYCIGGSGHLVSFDFPKKHSIK